MNDSVQEATPMKTVAVSMIIITTADPLCDSPTREAAPFEGPILERVGKFIASLPGG